MRKTFGKVLFLFRRDLRLEDNKALIFALESAENVIPAFILTPEQIEHNNFRSDHCLKFMLECLQDLDNQLLKKKGSLYLFKGEPDQVVSQCIANLGIGALIVNRDYTPYSKTRDEKLAEVCRAHRIFFYSFDDALLHSPEVTVKRDGTPYTIFTPYFKKVMKEEIAAPEHNVGTNYFHEPIPFAEDKSILTTLMPPVKNSLKGGRKEAQKILKKLSSLKKYSKLKDFPGEDYSTHLSPYLKFTVCSPREVYAAIREQLGPHHDLIRSLCWRDFFTSIAFFFPSVFKKSFQKKYQKLKWSNDKKHFKTWCQGMTGFPIVDAGIREMNATGFMHNRVRMIVASFLVKDLHIDWRWGEKYFAQHLIDYDPAVNNGNWQWVASTGCDAQPYFRIFNPWLQQKKFDPDCIYIKKWIPELRHVPPKVIHAWHQKKYHADYPKYPAPIVDHEKEAQKALRAYKAADGKRG